MVPQVRFRFYSSTAIIFTNQLCIAVICIKKTFAVSTSVDISTIQLTQRDADDDDDDEHAGDERQSI